MNWHLSCSADVRFDGDQLDRTWQQTLDWREAAVPSSVQNSAFGLPLDELYAGDNIRQVEWMKDYYWLYRTQFAVPQYGADEEAVVVFKGIDYKCAIYINGVNKAGHEGMFSRVEISLAEWAPGTELELLVAIEPFVNGEEPYEHLKARYSVGNGWDFAPKLQSAGIWDDVGIVVRPRLRVEQAQVITKLANSQRADVIVDIALSEQVAFGNVTVELDGVSRSFPVVRTDRLRLPLCIPSPTLWWPVGQSGETEGRLLTLGIELEVEGRKTEPFTQRTGIRSVERIACSGQGVEDIPLQLVVNGRKVFMKGVNWVPLDACPGSITTERYRLFLKQFKEAGVNMIRVWGGGLKEKDDFYALADAYGIMIMQEFPLACQLLARTERFYRLLAQEATAIIQSLKHHPSIVIWSGGNEHYHYWDNVDSGTDIMEQAVPTVRKLFGIAEDNTQWLAGADRYDEPALGLLGHLCALLDDSRPFQITSGMEGEGEVHGIWNWNPRIGDHRYRDYDSLYRFWREADQHLYSEASVSSIANLPTIRQVCGAETDQIPSLDHPVWQMHHAFKACWDGLDDLWLDLPSTERLFGRLDRIEDVVFANQWMQAEGGRFLIEEIRRKMDHTCGVIWWGVNEPWPSLAGNALIDYYGRPKLGWSFLANAFRPTILSLRYEHCLSRSVKPELWITHDGYEPFAGSYTVTLTDMQTGESETLSGKIRCAAYASQYIKTLSRTRMKANTRIHANCRLYAGEDAEPVHINDYVWGSIEDEAPFGGQAFSKFKSIFLDS